MDSPPVCVPIYSLLRSGAVGYCLQVVMSNGVTILIGHEVGEFLRFPVEKVQPTSFGTDPDIIVFIFHHITDERIIQAIVPAVVSCINRENICLRVEIIDTAVIGPQPDRALSVFVNGNTDEWVMLPGRGLRA